MLSPSLSIQSLLGMDLGEFDVSLKDVKLSYAKGQISALQITKAGMQISAGINLLGRLLVGTLLMIHDE